MVAVRASSDRGEKLPHLRQTLAVKDSSEPVETLTYCENYT
jgi:hypothetical protein